jgi:hypothetical protein
VNEAQRNERRLDRLVMRLACKLIGHRYRVARVLNYGAMQLTCKTCGGLWAMHHDTRSFLPWDADFEALYAPGGPLATEGPDSNRGVSQGEVAPRHESAQTMAHGSSAGGVSAQLPHNAELRRAADEL